MKRREFVNCVGLGVLASSLPVAIAACSPAATDETDTADASADAPVAPPVEEIDTSVREDGFAALGTVAALDSEGFLVDKNFAAGPVIVIRDPEDATAVVALNSTCNHQGCNVDWKETEFVCPCHGSKFGADGSLANGPATAPLTPFEAKVDGDLVLVKAA
ncbi:MAG: ubiquinol-cytochrome c reductase iron-sulfur subunit [Cyanobacteria bacterium J06597_16]